MNIEQILERKRGVETFYARYLDSEAFGGDRPDKHGG
jgi:hypothetical protein